MAPPGIARHPQLPKNPIQMLPDANDPLMLNDPSDRVGLKYHYNMAFRDSMRILLRK